MAKKAAEATPRIGNRSRNVTPAEDDEDRSGVTMNGSNDDDVARESSSTSPLASQKDQLSSLEHHNTNSKDESPPNGIQIHEEEDVEIGDNNIGNDGIVESSSSMNTATVGPQSSSHHDDDDDVVREKQPSLDKDGGRIQSRNQDRTTAASSSSSTIRTNNVKRNRKKTKASDKNSEPTHRRDKRGRQIRVVSIAEDESLSNVAASFPTLPGNQYTTTLRRRAIRKVDDANQAGSSSTNSSRKGDSNDFGDISLGMKLIVVGGRVIVQSLNPLADGLASPAQLAGVIQRGDVLLAVGNVSLVNLPVDQLMEGLRPLSSAGPGGYYERFLNLRFESATGFRLLRLHEDAQAMSDGRHEPESGVFSLFPMVDQLSGAPLFDNHHDHGEAEVTHDQGEIHKDDALFQRKLTDTIEKKMTAQDIDELISSTLAHERNRDKKRYESEYFDWGEDLSDLLRRTVSMVKGSEDHVLAKLTKAERLDLGKKIMETAKELGINLEVIDQGRDLRSFKTWNTNFSVKSGVSARRRNVMDNTSIRSSRVTDMDSDDGSIHSDDSGGSLDGVDADVLLLGLAARDEIWRRQVIDTLNSAAESLSREEPDKDGGDVNVGNEHKSSGIDEALKNQLGNFLFGQNMAKIVKQEKKSFALPPKDITRVFFDLTTNLATKSPDEITVIGASSRLSSNVSSLQSSVKTDGKARAAARADVFLANHFILDEALPRWLETFRPLPLEHRRTMWPRMIRRIDSMTGTYSVIQSEYTGRSSDGDSQTLDSGGSHAYNSSSLSKKKDLRELVEDYQIDGETRSETCFLVTYYYTRKVLNDDHGGGRPSIDPVDFVETYGSYLRIHSCLAFASSIGDESAIAALLKAASHDPTHKEAVKEIEKSNNLLFYDSSKLSAVLQFLSGIRYIMNVEKRKVIRDLCVSAYPDVRPWQVRKACLDPHRQPLDSVEHKQTCSDDQMENFYYNYMSNLLNPLDGHEDARHDAELVKEYCEWSVGILPRPNNNRERLKNFIAIASRSSIQYKRYRRDLMMLLDLSMIVGREELVLDLASEILENAKLLSNEDALSRVLRSIRKIGVESLATIANPATESMGFRILRRVVKLFERMSTSGSLVCRKAIVLSDELCTIFKEWKIRSGCNGEDPKTYLIIDFVINECSAPEEVLRALTILASPNDTIEALVPRLRSLLRRGVHYAALNGEMSGTLLQLKRARTTFSELVLSSDDGARSQSSYGIWQRMATGDLAMDK